MQARYAKSVRHCSVRNIQRGRAKQTSVRTIPPDKSYVVCKIITPELTFRLCLSIRVRMSEPRWNEIQNRTSEREMLSRIVNLVPGKRRRAFTKIKHGHYIHARPSVTYDINPAQAYSARVALDLRALYSAHRSREAKRPGNDFHERAFWGALAEDC